MKTAATQDFSDWLNPMLVKELRQGLKTHVFVGLFVLVQVAMILLMGFRLLSAGTSESAEVGGVMDAILWTALGAALLLIMPARGLFAISSEARQNTLDLVHLTNMGAWRIVLGKWIALMGQIGLLTVAVLPYAVLRYFFGGVDVVQDLTVLMGLLLLSMVMTAASVMLSTVSVITRCILVVVIGFTIVSGGLRLAFISAWSGSGPGIAFSLISTVVAAFVSVAFLLFLAASRIATSAENFALPVRGLALGTVLAVLAMELGFEHQSDLWRVLAFVMGGWAVFEALTEATPEIASLFAPLARRGFLTRVLGRMFYPGWATGLGYAAVMVTLLCYLAELEKHSLDRDNFFIDAPLFFLAAIFPLPVLLIFRMARKQPGWTYVLVQSVCLLIYSIARSIESFKTRGSLLVSTIDALTPTSAALSLGEGWVNDSKDMHWSTVPVITGIIGGCVLLWICFRAFREFRLIRQLERGAMHLGDKPAEAA